MAARAMEFGVERRSLERGAEELSLVTAAGEIRCRLHQAAGDAAIAWVFGSGGGFGGPAGGVYERLARSFQAERAGSLQLDYRFPGRMRPSVEDLLTGVAFLESLGIERVVLVGHSFGGAVVINAGVASAAVIAVAALSSQSCGASAAGELSPKRLLLVHGEEDEVLPPACSLDLYRIAHEPKELLLYPACRHGLDECRRELDRDLARWLRKVLRGGRA